MPLRLNTTTQTHNNNNNNNNSSIINNNNSNSSATVTTTAEVIDETAAIRISGSPRPQLRIHEILYFWFRLIIVIAIFLYVISQLSDSVIMEYFTRKRYI